MTATQEKVGALLVHGIGEQSQFEYLEGEVRNLATALQKAAAQTNKNYLITELQNWDNHSNNQQTKLILKKAIIACNKGNIKSAIAQLVQRQEQSELEGLPDEWIQAVAELPGTKKISKWFASEDICGT